jgi:hypothetical protein
MTTVPSNGDDRGDLIRRVDRSRVQQALLKLQKDGVYDVLLKRWGLSAKDCKPLLPINGAQLQLQAVFAIYCRQPGKE